MERDTFRGASHTAGSAIGQCLLGTCYVRMRREMEGTVVSKSTLTRPPGWEALEGETDKHERTRPKVEATQVSDGWIKKMLCNGQGTIIQCGKGRRNSDT